MNEAKGQDINENTRKKGKSKIAKFLLILITCSALAGGSFAGSYYVYRTHFKSLIENRESEDLKPVSKNKKTLIKNNDVSGIVKHTMPSVVAITNISEKEVSSYFTGERSVKEQKSVGSGIIVKEDGKTLYIVTNNHVVDGAKDLTVQFCDSKVADAEVQGNIAKNDLAVIKVKLSSLSSDTKKKIKVATLGNSSETKVGESAIAIGNALGYGQSVTTGIISAVDRKVSSSDESGRKKYTNKLIQTDAAINPGNSGGALLNAKGELIGINSAKYSATSVEGMGFAIPIDTAKKLIDQMIKKGTKDDSFKDSKPTYKKRYKSDYPNNKDGGDKDYDDDDKDYDDDDDYSSKYNDKNSPFDDDDSDSSLDDY